MSPYVIAGLCLFAAILLWVYFKKFGASGIMELKNSMVVLKDRASQFEAEKDRVMMVLRSMTEGVIVANRHQKITLSNPAAEKLLGFSSQDGRGLALWEVTRAESILKAAREILNAGEPKTLQIGPLHDRHLTLSLSPLASSGQTEGLVLVIHDTTESARYQELRKEFVANVSHELRTPVTLIRGFVETLQAGALQDPVKGPEFMEIVRKNADRLTRLVEDLLDLSRLESIQGLPRTLKVDLAALVQRVVELHTPAAKMRSHILATEVASGLPPIQGDPDYLERALSNLVDNAIKYTPEGGTIKISASQHARSVAVAVSDTGVGIPEADLPRIFERFYRVDKSRSREMGGTGLGLAIVKHVVQAHGGTVEVDSKVGQGTVFRLAFPIGNGS